MRYFTKTPHCRGVDNAGAVGENCSYGWRSAYSELAVKQGQSFSRHTCNGRDGDMPGGFTFAIYSHYNRGHFYNAHPKVYVTYKGGNHHKPAVRHEAPMMHNSKPAVHNDKKHGTNKRHMAMATNNNRSKSGHFSGRR